MNFQEHIISNISSTLDTIQYNKFEFRDYSYDEKLNYSSYSLSKVNLIENYEECFQANMTLPEKTLLNKKVIEPSENNFSNKKEKEESKAESSKITRNKLQNNKTKPKQKYAKFLIQNKYYSKSGYKTKRKSHRGSNCKNRILRNIIQDILIDWFSRSNIKNKNFPKLKKLKSNYLEVIYRDYMNLKNIKLKEMYTGDFFKEILEKDKHIFEFNKAIIEKYKCMEPKLNCNFRRAFNYFYDKENIISFIDDDLLNGLKSKKEYINEKGDKELLEKNMKELFDNINH